MGTERALRERVAANRTAHERASEQRREQRERGAAAASRLHTARTRYVAARAVATDSLRLGDADAASRWFGRATRHGLTLGDLVVDEEAALAETEPGATASVAHHYVGAVICGALSGVENTLVDGAVRAYNRTDRVAALVGEIEHAELGVLATAALDDEDVEQYAARLREATGSPDGATTVPPGHGTPLAMAAPAIVDRDPATVLDGVSAMLEAHRRRADDGDDPDTGVCHLATALLVVARQRDMAVEVDDEFVPAAVYDLG